MESTGKTNLDILMELQDRMLKGDKITLAELDEIVATRSVVDTVADMDAITVFYSGEPEGKIEPRSSFV